MSGETILLDPTEDQLASGVEENLYALFRAMVGTLGGELVETGGVSYHLSSPSNPMFKGVWNTGLAADEADDAIDEVMSWFEAREAPFYFWWTGTGTSPDDLGERLMARGLISMEEQAKELLPGLKSGAAGAPCMTANLLEVNDAVLAQTPEGFTIEEVRDEDALAAFTQVFAEGMGVPAWAAQAWADATRQIGIGQTPWRIYLGRLNGHPVASNMLFNGGGVASVYGVSTVPAARGQGIGAAITLNPLLDARDEGYRHAVLFSTDIAIRVYKRIGFRDCGTRINRYLWLRPE